MRVLLSVGGFGPAQLQRGRDVLVEQEGVVNLLVTHCHNLFRRRACLDYQRHALPQCVRHGARWCVQLTTTVLDCTLQ